MPRDDTLPASRLPARPTAQQVASHFPVERGVRVDLGGLEALPPQERLSLASARLPEPPEAVLLDRVLQLVPRHMLAVVERVLIVASGETARLGGFDAGIVRIRTPALALRQGDGEYGNRFSRFTTTVLHEIGHAVFERWLTTEQRTAIVNGYLDDLTRLREAATVDPSDREAQHYFISLLLPVLLGYGMPPLGSGEARRRLAALGVEWR
jgi:hypothetical protein